MTDFLLLVNCPASEVRILCVSSHDRYIAYLLITVDTEGRDSAMDLIENGGARMVDYTRNQTILVGSFFLWKRGENDDII